MFFHSIVMVEEANQAMTLKFFCSYSTETLLGFPAQKISKTWRACVQAANLAPFAKFYFLYIMFDSGRKQFVIRNKWGRIFAPLEQSRHLLHRKGTVDNETDVNDGV